MSTPSRAGDPAVTAALADQRGVGEGPGAREAARFCATVERVLRSSTQD